MVLSARRNCSPSFQNADTMYVHKSHIFAHTEGKLSTFCLLFTTRPTIVSSSAIAVVARMNQMFLPYIRTRQSPCVALHTYKKCACFLVFLFCFSTSVLSSLSSDGGTPFVDGLYEKYCFRSDEIYGRSEDV